jgi:ABC-2 type transport system ATP-binding protein
MRQKLGLIQALMHRPRLLILDEPTSGLDPLIRRELYDELGAISAEGRTVLFSSHTLSEVDELCEEVIVLRNGRLVEHAPVESLRDRAPRSVEIVFQDAVGDSLGLPPNLRDVVRTGARLTGRWSGPIGPLVQWLAGQAALRDLTVAPPDLESLFLAYYSGGDPTP